MTSDTRNEETQLERTVREFFEWYRAVTFSQLRDTVEEQLDTDERKLAYVLTAPDRSLSEIAKLIDSELEDGPSARTVSNWQQAWVRAGLMRQISPKKREPIFDIQNDFGIDLPAKLEYLLDEEDN